MAWHRASRRHRLAAMGIRTHRRLYATAMPADTPNPTRDMLQGYYPTGMALEGTGRLRSNGRWYPPDVPVDDDLVYKPETMAVMADLRDNGHPFQPREYSPEAVQEKLVKFTTLGNKLADIYGIARPNIRTGHITAETWNRPGASYHSSYNRATHTITIDGTFSLTTFLHEFSHSRGMDETDAQLWAVNLFKRIFPVSYRRLVGSGHTLIRRG